MFILFFQHHLNHLGEQTTVSVQLSKYTITPSPSQEEKIMRPELKTLE